MAGIGEPERLAVLRSYAVLDTPPEAAFDELAQAAARICAAPMSAVSLVDEARQWFKARVGLGVQETPRSVSFCTHAMWQDDLFVVTDATDDPMFAGNALVTGAPHIRFYAGAAIRTVDGTPLGALCVLDTEPRPHGLTRDQGMILRILANQVQAQLNLRAIANEQLRAAVRLRDIDIGRELALDAAQLGRFDMNPSTGERYFDKRAIQMLGVTREETQSREQMLRHVHPDDIERVRASVDLALDPNRRGPYREVFRIGQPAGAYRWISAMGRSLFTDGVCTRFMGVFDDVTEEMQVEEHRRLLVNELNHRVKNTLAVVQSLVDSTLRSTEDPVDARLKIAARIQALGGAHDILTAANWSAADIGEVAARVLGALTLPGERMSAKGPAVSLGPQPALQLSLTLHELATNALKYGALSNPVGRVDMAWSVEPDDTLVFTWTESGGPTVDPPTRRGFGTQLIERVVAGAFHGAVSLDYAPQGFRWRLVAPLAGLAEHGRSGPDM